MNSVLPKTFASDRYIPLRKKEQDNPLLYSLDKTARKPHKLQFSQSLQVSPSFSSISTFLSQSSLTTTSIHGYQVKQAQKVIEAPQVLDNFYYNVLDCSSDATLGLGLTSQAYLFSKEEMVTNVQRISNSTITSLKFMDNNIMAIGEDTGRLEFYDLQKQALLRQSKCHYDRIGCLELSGDRGVVFTGSKDNCIKILDCRSRTIEAGFLQCHRAQVCGLAYKGHQLASGGNDNKVCIWDLRKAKERKILEYHRAAVKAIQWCPWRTQCLATGGGYKDKQVIIWNGQKDVVETHMDVKSQVSALRWKESTQQLLTCHTFKNQQSNCYLWDYKTKKIKVKLHGHQGRILGMILNPQNDNKVVTLGADESLRYWELEKSQNQRGNSNSKKGRSLTLSDSLVR